MKTIPTYRRLLLAFLIGMWGFSASGCTWFDVDGDSDNKLLNKLGGDSGDRLLDKLTQGKPAPTPETSGQKKIRWDGAGIVLGEVDSSIFTTSTFLESIAKLTEEQRHSSIRNLVQKYPDVALQVLQEANPIVQDRDALQQVANQFDSLWCRHPNREFTGWQSYLVDLAATTRKKNSLLELKNQFWQHLKNNEPQQAIGLNITRSLPQGSDVILSSEFHRLEAIALMMNDQFKPAIDRLEQSIQMLGDHAPYQVARLKLLLGEFHRHNGDLQLWNRSWESAVALQAQLLNQHQLQDPSFWNRAAYLRPAKAKWPSAAIEPVKQYLIALEITIPEHVNDESLVWMAIGLQNNERAEGQHAVLAFKKSEATALDPKRKNELRLYQARSMVLAGQPGAASAILIRLISQHEGTMLADRARAILGAMKLQNGAIGQGINLIQSSMKTVDQWPIHERLRAQADYGLALLVSGDENNGLNILDQVQQEFRSRQRFDDLQQVLWNKAKYFEKTEQSQRMVSARNELSSLETLR